VSPQTAQAVREYVTAALLILGAAGAAWTWLFVEWLRRTKEIPALDGTFGARCCALDDATTAVEFSAIWRNRGTVPVFIDPRTASIDIFPLEGSQEYACFELFSCDLSAAILSVKPLSNALFYFLEPGTDSPINAVAVLPSNRTYVARFEMCSPTYGAQRRSLISAFRRFFPVLTRDPALGGHISWARIHLLRTDQPSVKTDSENG
jgi:hypothetical protein